MTRTAPRPSATRATALLAVPTLLLGGLLGACTSDSPDKGGSGDKPGDSAKAALAQARQHLEDTSGVHLSLTNRGLPDSAQGLVKGDGVLTDAPAFKGTITVQALGLQPEVPVVAVNDKVYAQVPFSTGWQVIDPADYGAPDPTVLMDEQQGITSILTDTTHLETGKSVRGGKDNKEILTSYSGTVPASSVAGFLPSASGDVDATYTVTDGGELRTAELTGDFYGLGSTMTYVLELDDYGTDETVVAPS